MIISRKQLDCDYTLHMMVDKSKPLVPQRNTLPWTVNVLFSIWALCDKWQLKKTGQIQLTNLIDWITQHNKNRLRFRILMGDFLLCTVLNTEIWDGKCFRTQINMAEYTSKPNDLESKSISSIKIVENSKVIIALLSNGLHKYLPYWNFFHSYDFDIL